MVYLKKLGGVFRPHSVILQVFAIRKPDRYPKFCSGQGYVLNHALVRCMVGKVADSDFMPSEDVFTGMLAEKCGVVPKMNRNVRPFFDGHIGNPGVVDTFHARTLEMIKRSWALEQRIGDGGVEKKTTGGETVRKRLA